MSEDFKMDTYFGFMQHSRSAEHGLMKACAEVEKLTAENTSLRERLAIAEAVCKAVNKLWFSAFEDWTETGKALEAWRNSQATPPGQEGAGK